MADAKTPYPVRLVTPDGVLFDDEAQLLIVTGTGGQAGFYARHAPLVADLKMGYVRLQLADGSWREWATDEGFAMVHDSTALVTVEEAVESVDIDLADAERIVADAQQNLEQAEAAMARSADDDDDPYRRDADACRRAIAWGENLRRVKEGAGATAGAAH